MSVDASVIIAWLAGRPYEELDRLLRTGAAAMAPVTVTELLSGKRAGSQLAPALEGFRVLPLREGYWIRAGALRSAIFRAGRKAGLGDALVAQACIDNDVPLLTRDRDFAAFAELGGLKLA